jgi:hypothetical protein
MTDLESRLKALAGASGRPLDALVRQHVLDGLLRRVAASAHAAELVLRGGLLTRRWVGAERRTTEDADFLGLFARDAGAVAQRLGAALAAPLPEDDGVRFDPDVFAELIWQETPFPGVHALAQAEAAGAYLSLQVDVGFDDPLVPPAEWVDYPTLLPGPPLRMLACRAETLVGWKLHGLFEHGAQRWRAKDLYDLLLLTSHAPLVEAELVGAIRVAFESRSQPRQDVLGVVYNPAWWAADRARERWAKFRAAARVPGVPEDVGEVARRVARALRPALGRLVAFPADVPGDRSNA